MLSPEAVLKVGGSLSRSPALIDLCQAIGRLGQRRRLLVVPGGGEFADLVREFDRHYQLDATTAHWMAILGMDQYGYLLQELIPGSTLVDSWEGLDQAYPAGQIPVLRPSPVLLAADPLPHSWQVTSDSLAAWAAGLSAAKMLVLLKDVDGLFSADPDHDPAAVLLPHIGVDRLTAQSGGVDGFLFEVLKENQFETWVINGKQPERLRELLDWGATRGTQITRSAQRGRAAGKLAQAGG